MSSDKRRRARVQGGWSAPQGQTQKQRDRTSRTKPASTIGAACLAKTVDVPNTEKFVFQEPEEVIRKAPEVKVIEKTGVHDLSVDTDGISRIRLFPHFIEKKECSWIYETLFHELPWRQRSSIKNGVNCLQPRLTAWFGDFPYSYSGIRHEGNDNWSPVLTLLKDRLEEKTGFKFNSLLANLYRDGHDSVDWHSDDESSLGRHPTIASLSFGDTRSFEMRKKPPKGSLDEYTYMQHVKIPLTSGSLLIMEGTTQDNWQHRIPKEYHDRETRINLTFRVIYPESE